jgi:erythrocyte band 7 integral membrane protein
MSTSLDTGAGPKDVDAGFKNGGTSSLNGGFRPSHIPGRSDNPMVNVQPPRREDLQPNYAQTLVGESDQGNHGWYGSMSKSLLDPEAP